MTKENINYVEMANEFFELVAEAYEEIQANKKQKLKQKQIISEDNLNDSEQRMYALDNLRIEKIKKVKIRQDQYPHLAINYLSDSVLDSLDHYRLNNILEWYSIGEIDLLNKITGKTL